MSGKLLLPIITLILSLALPCNKVMEPPVIAPFTGLDTICTNDWWNRAPNPIHNVKVERDRVVAFGLYTVSEGTLKLSAQLYPLYPDETRIVRLEVERDGQWQEIATAKVNDLGWSALIRVENWDATKDVAYRLRHGKKAMYQGLIRHDPVEKDQIVVAAFSCSSNKDRGESGKVSTLDGAADGGYTYHPEYVKMVERCQTANLLRR